MVCVGDVGCPFETKKLGIASLSHDLTDREFHTHLSVYSWLHRLARYFILNILNKFFPFHSAIVVDINLIEQSDSSLNEFKFFAFLLLD